MNYQSGQCVGLENRMAGKPSPCHEGLTTGNLFGDNWPLPVSMTVSDLAVSTDREFVKGLGLTSSTMLVMGSMIGSGIFLVSAEIAREVDSPALLIGAWMVTGL